MLIYAYIVHVIQYFTDHFAPFHYNFSKKSCHAFLYAGTIQLFLNHICFSLSSGSDTTLQIGQPRANFIFAYEYLFYFWYAISARDLCLFLPSSFFIFFFLQAHNTYFKRDDAIDLIKKSRR